MEGLSITGMKAIVRTLLICAAVGLVVYLISSFLPKTYASTQTLYFPNSQASGGMSPLAILRGGSGSGDSGTVQSLGGALQSPIVGSAPQTASGLIKSTRSLRNTVQELGLAQRFGKSEIDARKSLADMITVDLDRSGFLRITAQADDPEVAKNIVNSLGRNLNRMSKSLSMNVSSKNREFIEERLEERRRLVALRREELSRLLSNSPVNDPANFEKAYIDTVQRVAKFRIDKAAAESRLNEIEGKLASIIGKPAKDARLESSLQSLASTEAARPYEQSLNALANEIQQRRLELQDSIAEFTDANPIVPIRQRRFTTAVQVGENLLRDARQQIQKGQFGGLIMARAELRAFEVSIDASEGDLDVLTKQIVDTQQRFVTVKEKSKAFEFEIEGIELLETELEVAKIAEVRDPSTFLVVDEAEADPEPVAPRKALNAAIAFLVALAVQLVPYFAKRIGDAEPKSQVGA
jgi:capsular polysaccharide biosynthesis protein